MGICILLARNGAFFGSILSDIHGIECSRDGSILAVHGRDREYRTWLLPGSYRSVVSVRHYIAGGAIIA